MKKNEIQKYHSFIQENERTTNFLLYNNLIPDEDTYKKTRIEHYKLSNLLGVVTAIKDKTWISINSQSIFFDFPFIEGTLTKFSLDEQFRIFEIMLRKYIEEFENISFTSYQMFYGTFLLASKFSKMKKEENIFNETDAIMHEIINNIDNLLAMHEKAKKQCTILNQFWTSNKYNQKEMTEALLSLGISEPFVYYFIRYIEKKKEKKVFMPQKYINYFFENPDFIQKTTEKNDVQKEKRLREIFNKSYGSFKEKMNNDQKLYLTFYKNLFNTLKGNFGQQFVGFYEIAFFELSNMKANKEEIYNILIRVLLNDIQFLMNHSTYKCRNEEYNELRNTLKNNFTLQSFNENIEEDKLKTNLIKISFPEKYIDQFIQQLTSDYHTLFQRKKKPYENIVKISVEKKEKLNSNPTPIIEETKKKKIVPLGTILNNEELQIYQQVIEIIEENNSLIEGYINDLKISVQTINDAAELIMETPEDTNLLHECIKDEMQTIQGILENIYLLSQYKNILKPQKKFN